MMLNKKTIATTIATGSLVLNLFATTAFAETVTVTGNGADSSNTVTSTNNSTTGVTQSNNAVVTNNVSSNANTGGNSANKNTGGDVSVSTGDATSNTNVSTAANVNQANVDCGCNNKGTDVTISGNGAGSDNKATVKSSSDNQTSITQKNIADITNNVDANVNTGKNDANKNTGGTSGTGSVTVSTGDASSTVHVSNMANANIATIGGGSGNDGSGSSAIISGNGADSHNTIKLDAGNSALITQSNNAEIGNNVDSNANSGKNDANKNTGGDVTIDTGMADSTVTVDNAVNFNAADVSCDCFSSGDLLKIAGNGADTHNKITDNQDGSLWVNQGTSEGAGNLASLDNNVNGDAKTGKNDANSNTGAVLDDPTMVMTGDSSSTNTVGNTGNVNLYGPTANLVTLPGDVDFVFDWSSLLGMFGM